MRYNDRIEVISSQTVHGEMGDEKRDVSLGLTKCRVTGMSQAMNIGVFGAYASNAVAVHFKGDIDNVSYLVVNGVKRKPEAVLKARKNTIVMIKEV